MSRWLALVAVLAGCRANGAFSCETSEQCRLNGATGTCEPSGFCSFVDPSCTSGSRYDSLAGGGFAGVCVGDEPLPDAPDAAPPDPRCTTWTPPQHFDPCAIPMPAGGLTLTAPASPYLYDTTANGGVLTDKDGVVIPINAIALAQTGGGDVALLSVESLSIEPGATLDVVGSKPLLIASWTTVQITGVLDAGSHRGVRDGAGSEPADCATGAPTSGTGAAASGGSGGGGGGAFHGDGGAGGAGDLGGTPTVGGAGGIAVATAPALIRGGCAGAASGVAGTGALPPSNATTTTAGGRGGGAVRIVAFTSIDITGVVVAGGAGGGGSPTGSACGGGGGGSGGYVGLEAPAVTLGTGVALNANGGGGGGSGLFAGTGNPGSDSVANGTAAPGGASTGTCGVAGSAGSTFAQLDGAGPTVTDNCGGSGGGGAAGFTLVHATSFTTGTATPSPPAIVTAP